MDYLLELNRWGITEGLPQKPYVDADYIQADKNIQGINSALQYASANNYSGVVLPAGNYAICYPREITMVSNLDLNLNGSTLKVIYDSNKKSPFDNRTTTDYYNFKGNSIIFSKVTNSHLFGGTIIGCRDDRSFSNPLEVAMEHTYGVLFQKSSSYCSIDHCIVRDYMGDNISFSSDSIFNYSEFDQGLTLNALDYNTGQPIPSTNTLTTKLLNIPQNLTPKINSLLISGSGYARITNLNNKDFDIFFYDNNNKFIGAMKKRRIYTDISIPINATKFRLQFYNENNPSKNMQITIMFGGIPHHNVVEYNEIFNGHRGGITLGGNYNVIQHNTIRDNGKGLVRFLDGKPIFNDPTRYSINMEDSYGANCKIRDNHIYGSYHGILTGCFDVAIENNHIYNIDFIAINLYSLTHATIKGNFLYNCQNNIGLMTSNFSSAFVNITDNHFSGGKMDLNSLYYRVMLSNNHYVNPEFVVGGDNCTFKDNYVIYTDDPPSAPRMQLNKMSGCTFKSVGLQREVTFKVREYNNCTFDNLKVRSENPTPTVPVNCEFNRSEFIGCELRNHIYNYIPMNIVISKSKLTDTTVEVGITNVDNQNPNTSLEDCIVNINTKNNLFLSDTNRPYTTYKAERCRVTISNPAFASLLASGSAAVANELILKDSDFVYTGTTPLSLKYYTNKNHIRNFTSSDNTFVNINLPTN
ncbi:right-handed parallel beta-helix repeat-containing protein [Bacillus sp. DX4.1]|uniref:right-handed parallel beta-helix repeat-containing protein n=1 Tax=Bacillus sp. DX4.1 TaxID=3055867 RepID=UPI0025A15C8D|nr:right-handed parallel beta-helix repeat-containing protein [Bacillus sp. DX4.1]MDM5188555.1 right-handed parallel beta-helix repeat-containing protein [Bacillus sp. DX4.1]